MKGMTPPRRPAPADRQENVCMYACLLPTGGTRRTCGSPPHPSQEVVMILLVVAAVLAVLWLLGFLAFHVTAFAIHLLLIAAVIAVIAHFVVGRRSGRTRVCPRYGTLGPMGCPSVPACPANTLAPGGTQGEGALHRS